MTGCHAMNDTYPQSHFNVSLGVRLSFKHALRSSGLCLNVSNLSDALQGTECFWEDLLETRLLKYTKMQLLMAARSKLPAPRAREILGVGQAAANLQALWRCCAGPKPETRITQVWTQSESQFSLFHHLPITLVTLVSSPQGIVCK